jgi:hypothetical protein
MSSSFLTSLLVVIIFSPFPITFPQLGGGRSQPSAVSAKAVGGHGGRSCLSGERTARKRRHIYIDIEGEEDRRSSSKMSLRKINETFLCYNVTLPRTNGVWKSKDALVDSLPLFFSQLSVILFVTRLFFLVLKPLHQPPLVAEILVINSFFNGETINGCASTLRDQMFACITFLNFM